MITDLNEILVEWAYRTNDGKPDVKSNAKLLTLEGVLKDFGWSREARAELLSTLMETDIVKNKDSGNIYTVQNVNKDKHILVKKDASDDEIAKVTKKKVDKEKTKDDSEDIVSKLKKELEGEISNHLDYKSRLSNIEARADFEEDIKKEEKLKKELRDLRDSISTIEGDFKDRAATLVAIGHLYGRRENSGFGKNNLGLADRDQLFKNKENLMELYDDAKPDLVEKGVRKVRKNKVSEDFVNESFDTLPKPLQEALSRKGKVGKPADKKHFLGYVKEDGSITSDVNDPDIKKDENGKPVIKRGGLPSKDRARLIWRIYLEQGGIDAYTGLPLDLESMDLEHVVAFDNNDKGKPTVDDYKARENDKNMVMTATNLNQKKKDMSMEEFYEKEVRTQYSKTPEDFKKESEIYEEANTINSVAEQFIPTLLSEGVLKNSTMTSNVLNQHFKEDDERFERVKNTLREVATSTKDKKKAGDLKSKFGKRMCMSMGLTRGLRDKSGRRSVSFSSDNIYRGFLLSMADVPVEERQKYKDGWAKAIKEATNIDKEPFTVPVTTKTRFVDGKKQVQKRSYTTPSGKQVREKTKFDSYGAVTKTKTKTRTSDTVTKTKTKGNKTKTKVRKVGSLLNEDTRKKLNI